MKGGCGHVNGRHRAGVVSEICADCVTKCAVMVEVHLLSQHYRIDMSNNGCVHTRDTMQTIVAAYELLCQHVVYPTSKSALRRTVSRHDTCVYSGCAE
jgi:hypothetical protein